MVLELKLRKVGKSVSVTEGPDGSLRLAPATSEVSRQMEAVQVVMQRYRHTLRELAK